MRRDRDERTRAKVGEARSMLSGAAWYGKSPFMALNWGESTFFAALKKLRRAP
jgi:hypothetical protein